MAYADASTAAEQAAPRAEVRRRPDPLRSGVLWIVVAGILLAGLVAVNVAVLELNVRLDGLRRERVKLRDENAALASQFSSAKASPLIQARARARGFVPARPTYLDLGKN